MKPLILSILLLTSTSVFAEDFGGVNLTCISNKEKPKVIATAKKMGYKVTIFDEEKMTTFLDNMNKSPPETTMEADGMVVFRSPDQTIVSFDEGDKYCMSPTPFPNKIFDKLMEGVDN